MAVKFRKGVPPTGGPKPVGKKIIDRKPPTKVGIPRGGNERPSPGKFIGRKPPMPLPHPGRLGGPMPKKLGVPPPGAKRGAALSGPRSLGGGAGVGLSQTKGIGGKGSVSAQAAAGPGFKVKGMVPPRSSNYGA